MSGTTTFQEAWLSDPEFKQWVKRVDQKPRSAFCLICRSEFSLSNMGRQALRSHMKAKKHLSMTSSNSKTVLEFMSTSEKQSSDQKTAVASSSTVSSLIPETKSVTLPVSIPADASTRTPNRTLDSFAIKNDVTEAETLWSIQTVMAHKSLRTAEKDVSVMQKMFKDSKVAEKMQLKKDKIAYVLMYGVAPYYRQELAAELKLAPFYVVGFDESLNKISKKQQMDITVRYWDQSKNEVATRYLTSQFLGRSRAVDLLEAFEEGTRSLSLERMLQISMDGPNVNWAFLRELSTRHEHIKLLDLGSCGLHILHGAFKDGVKTTEWDVDVFLRDIYNLFKDVPARRALYTQYSKSELFPLKFGSHRWLENCDVAQRGIDIIPFLRTFTDGLKKDKKEPTSATYRNIVKSLKDPLLPAKLAFFKSVATEVEPMLREFQTDDPMVPFLHSVLTQLLRSLIDRFMKTEKIKSVSQIKKVDVENDDNIVLAKDVVIGYDAKKAIKEARKELKEVDIQKFRVDCKKFLRVLVCKMLTRSPLTYPLTKASTCLDPALIVNDKDISKQRLDKLLTILSNSGKISGTMADAAAKQYGAFIANSDTKGYLKQYKRSTTRLDHFWRDVCNGKDELLRVVQIVCCMSHGNASVERGFSVNNECLFENMREESLITRRIVYDSVKQKGGVDGLEIPKTLLLGVRNSHSRYVEDIKQRKIKDKQELEALSNKRKLELEAKELEVKKIKLLENAQREAAALEDKIAMLRKK